MNAVSTTLRLGSRIACLIVFASFVLFVIDQAGNASAHQQNEVNASAPADTAPPPKPIYHAKKDTGGIRARIDEASSTITSPFASVVAGAHNEWANRGVRLVLALLVYGFGVGYLARLLRVRV